MTASKRIGPLVAAGPLLGIPGGQPEYTFDAGPSVLFQGVAMPDPRAPYQKDYAMVGGMPAHYLSPRALALDCVPIAMSTTNIAAAQNVPAGLALTLASAGVAGISTGVSIRNASTGAIQTGLLAIEFGFGAVSTTSGSTTITPASGTIGSYYPGQWLAIPNGLTATTTLFTRVVSVGATTIVVSTAPGVTSSVIRAGACDPLMWGALFAQDAIPLVAQPYLMAGYAALLDPIQSLARNVRVTGSASSAGQNFTVRGFDVYGYPMSEVIAGPAGATTTSGKKAFKYILSVTGTSAEAQNYSVGTGDIFGFPLRVDRFEQVQLYWVGALVTASTGWLTADATSPATGTTGDVRGTYAVQGSASDGSRRLVAYITPSTLQMVNTFPSTGLGTGYGAVPLYGVAQFTN